MFALHLRCKLTLALALAMLGLPAPCRDLAGEEPGPGDYVSEEVQVGNVERVYRLIVPKSLNLQRPAPLVVAFHGMLIDSKDLMPVYTKFAAAAEKHQFLVAFPNAVERSFGLQPEKIKADLAFFDALVKQVGEQHRVDPKRLYVCGLSNGGYFAHLVARERSTVVAAAASHSGPLGLQTLLGVRAERKFPVLILHGDKDPLFPVAFARENRDKYQREGHAVEYVELPGHGHLWSDGATEKIWAFFAKHPRP